MTMLKWDTLSFLYDPERYVNAFKKRVKRAISDKQNEIDELQRELNDAMLIESKWKASVKKYGIVDMQSLRDQLNAEWTYQGKVRP